LVVVVVLLSCSRWNGAAGRDGTATDAHSSPSSLAIVNETRGGSSDERPASRKTRSGKVTPTPKTTKSKASVTPVVSLTAAQLDAKVDAPVSAATAHVAVDIALADGTTLYQHEPETLFDAASLYKLGIMVEV
jgi:hypothetical protein